MKVTFKASFYRQLQNTDDKRLAIAVVRVIGFVKSANEIKEIPNIKKLKGHKTAYRIRIGSFRIGIFIRDNQAEFAAIVHRKDFYKGFP